MCVYMNESGAFLGDSTHVIMVSPRPLFAPPMSFIQIHAYFGFLVLVAVRKDSSRRDRPNSYVSPNNRRFLHPEYLDV